MDDDVKKATAKALEWLASKQNANGSWGDAGTRTTRPSPASP